MLVVSYVPVIFRQMGLSNAEKQRRYRLKIMQSSSADAYKKYECARKKCQRNNLSHAAMKSLHHREKVASKKYRDKQKQKIHPLPDIAPAPLNVSSPIAVSSEGNDQSTSSAFSTRQHFGKAKKKVLIALPKSPKKRNTLIFHLAQLAGLTPTRRSAPTQAAIPIQTQQQVIDFFRRDDISQQSPCRKDVKIIRKEGVPNEKLMKRYMSFTLRESLQIFLAENPEQKLGLSKFCSLRPPDVQLAADTPANVCVCQLHANVQFLLDCASQLTGIIPKRCRDFVASVTCDRENVK